MDARITKQRLGNLLSYDWLKILLAIAASVAVLVMFFTMVAARPTAGQTFTVYGYTDVVPGSDQTVLANRLQDKGVFSYDILKMQSESFYNNSYAGAAYEARRSSGEGTVMFLSDYVSEADREAGKTGTLSMMASSALIGDTMYLFYNPVKFMSDTEEYLASFFAGDWRAAEAPSDEAVRAAFEARNGNDKRFRYSSEKYEKGVVQEEERILKLRADYLAVESAFESGTFTYTEYTAEDGKTYPIAINVGRLPSITELYYYVDESGNRSAEQLNLMIFDNGDNLGDLQYDTISFLKYLVEQYGS